MSAQKPESHAMLRKLVEDFLDLLSDDERQVMRLGAISNAFTSQLIQRMAGEGTDVPSILKSLQEYQFLSKGEGNWYFYRPDVREILQNFWQRGEHRKNFQEANNIAVDYFTELSKQSDPPAKHIFQREVLYHLLLKEEKAGLNYLADLFEQACDQHQLVDAQNYLSRLTKTLPQLSSLGREYASFYQTRLDFLLNRRENLVNRLVNISTETSDPLLKARTGILLSQVWLSQYEWKKSADILKTSLATLKRLKAWRYTARAMLVFGDIYVDLVENSGGIQIENRKFWGKLNRLFYILVFMPYLILDWLRRKINFFPGWLYFSGNYQEWILNYLLQMAGGWYHKAQQAAQTSGDNLTALNALIGQANVAIQQRREARARKIYTELAQHSSVISSRYRTARVLHGLGQISLLAGKPIQAIHELKSAFETFQSFKDVAALAQSARNLGNAYQQVGNYGDAAQAFMDSFRGFQTTHDPLPQTQIYWQLQDLNSQINEMQISNLLKQQIEDVLVSTRLQEYLARFPSQLLRQFRNLAYLVSLPLSYLLVLVIGVAASITLIAIESAALQTAGTLSLIDFLALSVVTLLPIPLTFWIIEMVYSLLGQAWIRLIGRKSLSLLGEQPNKITVTPDRLQINHPYLGKPTQLAWQDIRISLSANYKLWHVPIFLLSRQYLAAAGKPVILEGITSGYENLSREIKRKLSTGARYINADMTILASRTTYLAVLAAMLHALLLVFLNQGSITVINMRTCEETPLFLSILMVFFILNLIMILPPTILWRIYLQRQFLLRQLNHHPEQIGKPFLLTVTIILSVFAIFWLVTTPTLKIGGASPKPEECNPQQTTTWTEEYSSYELVQLPKIRIIYSNKSSSENKFFLSFLTTFTQTSRNMLLVKHMFNQYVLT